MEQDANVCRRSVLIRSLQTKRVRKSIDRPTSRIRRHFGCNNCGVLDFALRHHHNIITTSASIRTCNSIKSTHCAVNIQCWRVIRMHKHTKRVRHPVISVRIYWHTCVCVVAVLWWHARVFSGDTKACASHKCKPLGVARSLARVLNVRILLSSTHTHIHTHTDTHVGTHITLAYIHTRSHRDNATMATTTQL